MSRTEAKAGQDLQVVSADHFDYVSLGDDIADAGRESGAR